MGYTTEFDGFITIQPPLSEEERQYLIKFSDTRRMLRVNGPYFVEGSGFCGQGHDDDVQNYNKPPEGQPGLWCNWTPNHDGTAIIWNKAEKFYYAEEWMKYLIDHFLSKTHICPLPFLQGHTLNGRIKAQGEDMGDRWELVVKDNDVTRIECPWHASELETPTAKVNPYVDQAPDCGIEWHKSKHRSVAQARWDAEHMRDYEEIERLEAEVSDEPIIRSCGDCKHYRRRRDSGEDRCNKFKAHYSDWAQLTTKEARADNTVCGILAKAFEAKS